MAAIQYLAGDATVPPAKGPKIIAHVCNDRCNDRGGWGNDFELGAVQVVGSHD